MKLANVTPVYKKGSRSDKGTYRPVSILPNLSKVFEKCVYRQLSKFYDEILSKYQCGFRRGHGAQQHFFNIVLIALLEKWRISVDQGLELGQLLTDLSKAFDCLPHSLLLAKLSAYGFDMKALHCINDYLRDRKQELRYQILIALGRKFYMEFLKDQYWDRCYSI